MPTLKQAQARYKQSFKVEAPADMTVEQLIASVDKNKADKEAAKAGIVEAKPSSPTEKSKFKVNKAFPKVHIPKMGDFTAAELEANADACQYLFEIGSPVVTKI